MKSIKKQQNSYNLFIPLVLTTFILYFGCNKIDKKQSIEIKKIGNIIGEKGALLYKPTTFTIDDYGNIYVGDEYKIKKYTHEGDLIAEFGEKGKGPSELLSIYDIEIMNDKVYVADYWNARISIYSCNGKFIRSIQLKNRINELEINPQEYFYTIFYGATRDYIVNKFDKNGIYISGVGKEYYRDESNPILQNLLNGMSLDLNQNKNILTLAYWMFPKVEIYNGDGDFIREVKYIPRYIPNPPKIGEDIIMPGMASPEFIPYSVDICSNGSYILVLDGSVYSKVFPNIDAPEGFREESWVYCFNIQGQYIGLIGPFNPVYYKIGLIDNYIYLLSDSTLDKYEVINWGKIY